MEYFFITKLFHFKLNKILNRGITIKDDIRLSNSRNRVEDNIGDIFIKNLIGELEYDNLLNCHYIYAVGNIEENMDDENKRISLINYYLAFSQIFCNSLWLIRDNSVNNESGFLCIKKGNKIHSVTSNMRTALFLNSSGEYKEEEFTDEEIKKINISLIRFFNIGFDKTTMVTEELRKMYNNSNRLERFFYFLQGARTQGFIPNRIALYCTMLETILSTDTIEISHKIAERAAKIIGQDYEERLNIFTIIKDAYSIRSSAVHGDKLKKQFRELDKLCEISKGIDDVLRNLILYLLNNEEILQLFLKRDNNNLNQWFNELIFK